MHLTACTALLPAAEEPFSILPLEDICASLEEKVAELHALHSGAARAAHQPGPAVPAAALVCRALELPAAAGFPFMLAGSGRSDGSSSDSAAEQSGEW